MDYKRIIEMEALYKQKQVDTVYKLARKAITYFKDRKLNGISIDIDIRNLGDGADLSIVVFNENEMNNCSFYFYSGSESAKNELMYSRVIKTIKTGSFDKIKEYSKIYWRYMNG